MKSRITLAVVLTLFAVTLAVFSRAAFLPFCIIDDSAYVTDNINVMSGLTLDSIKWALTSFHAGNWHPATWLSLMLDRQLFGLNPVGFHLVNVVLHALNASLLFLLLRYMTGALWRSAFVAACFALHPLHVESVAWVAERKDVLSALFWILTLMCYKSYALEGKKAMYLLSLAAFALGLMAKPMLVTLPLILLLIDYWPLGRLRLLQASNSHPDGGQPDDNIRFSTLLLEKVPFIALAVASSIATLYAQKPSISSLGNVPLIERCTNAVWALLMYPVKMVFPFDLAILYPLVRVPLWTAGFAAAVLGAITFMVIRYMSGYRYLATGWFWYLITLLPVIGIIQVGRQAMADRYTYIPLIGLFMIVSWGGAELCTRLPKLRNAMCVAASITVVCLSVATWIQLGYWRDNMDLVRHTLDVTDSDRNYYAHYLLGMLYEKQGKSDLAIAEYQESMRIEPRDPLVHFDLAYIFDRHGKTPEAIVQYKEVLALDPGFAQGHFSLGIVLERTGQTREAIGAFNEALRLEPDNPKYLNNLGIVMAQQGMLDEAIALFSKALQVNPDDEKASDNLNIALQQQKSRLSGR